MKFGKKISVEPFSKVTIKPINIETIHNSILEAEQIYKNHSRVYIHNSTQIKMYIQEIDKIKYRPTRLKSTLN